MARVWRPEAGFAILGLYTEDMSEFSLLSDTDPNYISRVTIASMADSSSGSPLLAPPLSEPRSASSSAIAQCIWRSLSFAVGLHAGWVFLMQTERLFVEGPTGQRAIYGEGGLLAGWPGWSFLLITLAALRLGTSWSRTRGGT